MSESISQRTKSFSLDVERDMRKVLDAINTDIGRCVTDITALRAAIVAITAKLDADGGVTDVNYASTTNPAAQTSTTRDLAS